jgi:hypothetical protein
MQYVVDANFFIQSHRSTYPLDVVVSFWAKLQVLAASGILVSIDKVKGEIYGQGDTLEQWCRHHLPSDFFKDTDTSAVLAGYRQAVDWVNTMRHHYHASAVQEFLDSNEADPFLAAYVHADKEHLTLVTQEVSNPNRKNKVQLPECCHHLGVRYIGMMEMFRELGETF